MAVFACVMQGRLFLLEFIRARNIGSIAYGIN